MVPGEAVQRWCRVALTFFLAIITITGPGSSSALGGRIAPAAAHGGSNHN